MYYFCNALLPTLSKRCSRLFTATYKLRNKGPLSASVVPRRTFSGKMFFTLRKIVILITFLIWGNLKWFFNGITAKTYFWNYY